MGWLNLRDNNTKFFHHATMQNRLKNKVLRIRNDDNSWIEEEEWVIGKFDEYFKKVFSSRGIRDWGDILEELLKLVVESMNVDLVRKVIE